MALAHWLICGALLGHGFDEPKAGEPPAEGVPEDAIEPLVPTHPMSKEESARLEAEKLYVIGLGQLDRRELLPAMRTFEQALEYDPKNLPVLKELVPLALQLGEPDRGLDYCKRALDLDQSNFRLLVVYAGRLAELGRIEEAVESLKRAAAVPAVRTEDIRAYLQIRSDLVQHLDTLGRIEEAIEPLRDLIDAAEHPDENDLTEFSRRQLERRQFSDYEHLGRALAKAGKFEEAIATLERGRESTDPRAKRLALALAEVYFEHGELEKAAEELSSYMAAGTRNRDALLLFAKILEKQGRSEELQPQLLAWLEADEENPELREYYTELLIDSGNFEEAEKQIGRLRRSRGSAMAIMTKLYRKVDQPDKLLATLVESDRGRPNAADADLQEQIDAIVQEPKLVEGIAEAARALPADHADRFAAQLVVARMASLAKLPDLAIEFLTLCVNERPSVLPLQEALLDMLSRNERFSDLLAAVERAEKANPAQKGAFVPYHARALEQMGRTEDAVAFLDAFIEEAGSGPDGLGARLELARVYMQAEQYDQAIETCQEILADFPDSAQSGYTRYLLGSIYGQKGDMQESERILLELLEDPSLDERLSATVHNDLGYTWADQGKNLDRAEVLIRRALDSQPGQAAYLDSLGWVLFKKGEYEEAVKHLEEASKDEDGQDAVIYEHLGDTLLKLDRLEEAGEAWKKSLELIGEPKTKKEREQRAQIEKKIRLLLSPE